MCEVNDEPTEDIHPLVGKAHNSQITYTYFGQHRSPRWSDHFDYDRMVEEVPDEVKR